MAFELRELKRQRVRYDSANDDLPLQYQLVDDGAKVVPTSATISIYRNGGTTALVSSAAMTVSGSICSYVLDTTTEATWLKGAYQARVVVTAGGVTFDRHFFFDIVPFYFDPNIGFDQLVALDDGIRGMLHDGDPSFAALIQSCAAVLQAKLEAKVVRDRKLVQEMIVDHAPLASAFRFYILARIWENKGAPERADRYYKDFTELFDAILSSLRYDTGLSGAESSEIGKVTQVRLGM